MGTVEQIFIATAGGQPMQAVDEVGAVANRGLEGDRYLTRRGYWSGWDECQVTLIDAEVLDRIAADGGPAVGQGQHRRNLVVRGVQLAELADRRFRVGEAVLVYDRPRPPCRYIEGLTEPGMTRALGARRGGICARVVESGAIRVGDTLEVLDEAAPARPRQRLRPGPVLRRS